MLQYFLESYTQRSVVQFLDLSILSCCLVDNAHHEHRDGIKATYLCLSFRGFMHAYILVLRVNLSTEHPEPWSMSQASVAVDVKNVSYFNDGITKVSFWGPWSQLF